MERKTRHKLSAEFILAVVLPRFVKQYSEDIVIKNLNYERTIGKIRSALSGTGTAFSQP